MTVKTSQNNNNAHQFDENAEYDGHIDDDGTVGEGKDTGVVIGEEITEDKGGFVVWNMKFIFFSFSLFFLILTIRNQGKNRKIVLDLCLCLFHIKANVANLL